MERQGAAIKARPLQRVSTVDALTAALREQILDGTLAAGTGLREAELSESFGVSRHSVRTALLALRHEGLVQQAPNRGAVVNRPSADDVRNLFELREILEVNGIEALSKHPDRLDGPRAAVAHLSELAAEDASWSKMRDADLAFHAALVTGLDNPRISQIHAGLLTELRLCFLHLRHQLRIADGVVREHSEILEAIESGATEEAIRLLREHLQESREYLAGVYSAEA